MKYLKEILTIDIVCAFSLGLALIICVSTGYSPEVTGTIVGAIGGAIGGKAVAKHELQKELEITCKNKGKEQVP